MGEAHIIVIGAGLAGLAVAQGLKKNGISYVVLERESTPRDRNWGVTISWSHPSLAKLLPEHLYATLSQCQPDPTVDTKKSGQESVLIRDGLTGKTLIEPPFPGIRRMQIVKTKKAWSKDINIKFGKRLKDIEITSSGVIAHLEDGSAEAGTVIIGADGGSSQVRRWLLKELAAPDVMPYTFMNFPLRYNAEQALYLDKMIHPIVDVGTHPNKNMYLGVFLLDKPDLDRPETWIFYILATWPITTKEDEENSSNRLERLRAKMEDWAEPFKSAIEWAQDDVVIPADQLKIWHTKPFDNHDGAVTMAGDAAHSMTFHRGQGGNNAFCDAGHFVEALCSVQKGEKSLKEAIDEYDAGVLARGSTEVEISRVQTIAINDYPKFLKSPIFTIGINPSTAVK